MDKNSDLPNVSIPKSDAEQRINSQLAKGYEIRKAPAIKEMRQQPDVSKWSDFNIELLGRIFDNSRIANEYGTEYEKLRGMFLSHYVLDRGITRMESILQRLELISEIPSYSSAPNEAPSGLDVFIVHGHDEAGKESVARFVEKLGLKAAILHEQPNAGRTIIEKFEQNADVGFAIVLLTPDDIGGPKDKPNHTKSRARQNVILELGYFMGKLGRGRVCALYKEGVEIPSDYEGGLYIPMNSAGAWRMAHAKEIKNAGIDVDLNKVL